MPFKDHERKLEWDRAYHRAKYSGLTGVEYALLLMRRRRTKALARMAQRNNKED